MSGNASSGMRRKDQIPAKTSSRVPINTRKRFCAHQSIQREITLHSFRGVHAELFACDDLPVFLGDERDLPRSPAAQLTRSFIEPISFVSERNLRAHGGHAHRRHGGHGKGDGDFRTRDWSSARIREAFGGGGGGLFGAV